VQREAEEQEEGGGGATRGSGVMRGMGEGRDVVARLRDGGATRQIIPANKKLVITFILEFDPTQLDLSL
jgi:hypothetical protein